MRTYQPLQPPVIQQHIIDSKYKYKEYSPSRSLMPYVACYWTINIRASDREIEHRVIPDGCLDIIFDLRPSSVSRTAFITGLMPAYEVMRLTGDRSLFGIRFYLETAHRILKHPASSFAGERVWLEEAWGREAGLWSEQLLYTGGSADLMIPVVESKLKGLLAAADGADMLEPAVYSGMEYMYAERGNLSVTALADKLSYSERHVRRMFRQALGTGPKELLHIVKFQCMLQQVVRVSPSRFADVAAQHGYYDQSHLNRSFRRYYGLSPANVFPSVHPSAT